MNASLSEIAGQLKDALETSQKAHKALDDAKATLEPLETAAKDADKAVNVLMSEYQSLTNTKSAISTHLKNTRRGGAGKKRGPRSTEAVLMTSATRLLGELHQQARQKKQAINAATERAEILASGRGEKLTDEIRAAISEKADSIWSGAKK